MLLADVSLARILKSCDDAMSHIMIEHGLFEELRRAPLLLLTQHKA